ncbi:hypothetical protein OKW33_006351 [Paraburkholderia atlantica]
MPPLTTHQSLNDLERGDADFLVKGVAFPRF